MQVAPGRGIGFLTLGSSLYDILSSLKSKAFSKLELSYWPSDPLAAPVVLNLPANGLRLRFDGPDQRLRLIEVLDFSKTPLTYDGKELKVSDTGPTFRYVYDKLLGPSFPGEYVHNGDHGSYILSYPGIAFSFGLPSWRSDENFVTLLSTPPRPASSLVIFSGNSWQEASRDLYNRPCSGPKAVARADEVELVRVLRDGQLRVQRRASPGFTLRLGHSTPQDLVAELGPPDAIYVKSDRRLSIHKALHNDDYDMQLTKYESDRSSRTDDSEDSGNDTVDTSTTECFYNYFRHGLDLFVTSSGGHLVVCKILLHGNVPGSYPFNRYRRIRWVIDESVMGVEVYSETSFHHIARAFHHISGTSTRGMPINRDWDSPGSSCELLGGWEEGTKSVKPRTSGYGNTELFGYPGFIFEVLKNDAVSCLTLY